MKINEIKVKSVLVKTKLPGADYVINPYIGCQHACIYCYADFMKRFSGHEKEDWGSFLDVKTNAPETLPKSLKRDSLILIGSVTDPYQPLEARYRLTRRCLEKLLELQPRVEILTKSPLVLRDLDLLKKFEKLRVGISIGILDENYAKQLEPNVASPSQRIGILKKLHEAGISAYLFISPIFPGLTDIKALIAKSRNYVNEVLFENLNIRANNRARIFGFLTRTRPDLLPLYKRIQRNRDYWGNLESEIRNLCNHYKISYKIYFHHDSSRK